MISVEEAHQHVQACARILLDRIVPLNEARGLRLAESVVSNVDSPPFDKSMLDGYAIAVQDSSSTLRVIEEVHAGGTPHHAVEPGTTIRLMTGAPVPDGANAVIKHEDVKESADKSAIEFRREDISEGSGILPRGCAFHRGEEVLAEGKRLTPIDLALLAEVGRGTVPVTPRPQVAVLATGDELVEPGQVVGPAQICNSNGPMLLALLEDQSVSALDLGIARDDPRQLKHLMEQGLEKDLLIVTGGVSAGVMDLVPGVLKELGVEQVFHKVRIKPGKPLWFGQRKQEKNSTLVFGLPGNPVSTLVSFFLFVRPSLEALAGHKFDSARLIKGLLSEKVSHRGKRPTYLPSRVETSAQGDTVIAPLPWRGSADLAALSRANALAVLPEGDYQLGPGETVEFLRL